MRLFLDADSHLGKIVLIAADEQEQAVMGGMEQHPRKDALRPPTNPAEHQPQERARQQSHSPHAATDKNMKQAEQNSRRGNRRPGRQATAERAEQVAAEKPLLANGRGDGHRADKQHRRKMLDLLEDFRGGELLEVHADPAPLLCEQHDLVSKRPEGQP